MKVALEARLVAVCTALLRCVILEVCMAQSGAVQDDVSWQTGGAERRGPPLALLALHQPNGQLGHVPHHRHARRQQRLLQRRERRSNSLPGASQVLTIYYIEL